jgi:NAD(P)H-flavin reductase
LLPFHYLLALKSPYSPLQYLTRFSHEELNCVHNILGRIIHVFFLLHAVFYLVFFVSAGVLSKRITDTDVILGLISIFCFDVVGTSALAVLRRRSYRVFYLIHVIMATALLPLLYFHVHHIRMFILQTLAVWALLIFARWWSTDTHLGSFSTLPGTDLVMLRLRAATASGDNHKWLPGQHVYLHAPLPRSMGAGVFNNLKQALRTNPFTIASIPSVDKTIILVARIHTGNTAALAALASSISAHSGSTRLTASDSESDSEADQAALAPLRIEGPYGQSSYLTNFARCDSVLLLAGGVGATFALPLWRALQSRRRGPEVRLVWAVRTPADAAWAGPWLKSRDGKPEVYISGTPRASRGKGKGRAGDGEEGETSYELEEREGMLKEAGQKRLKGAAVRYERVDVAMVINEVVEDTRGRVAIAVCGPDGMVKQARSAVGAWVKRGRDVVWHAESFGF